MRKTALQPYIKKTMRWYFLQHGILCLLITKMFLYWIFWGQKIRYFLAKKLMQIWYLLITQNFLFWSFREWEIQPFLSQKVAGKLFTDDWKVLVLIFSGMGNTVFLEPKVDGKMIFTSCWEVLVLNFSVMRNTTFFSAKKLMERWYLLSLFELSMIFQDLGNMVFRAVSS